MKDHATLTCGACARWFDADLPLSRAGFARSKLMFLVEVCPHCHEARSYLRSDYCYGESLTA